MTARAQQLLAAMRQVCLTELSTTRLVLGSLALSAILWAAILTVL